MLELLLSLIEIFQLLSVLFSINNQVVYLVLVSSWVNYQI